MTQIDEMRVSLENLTRDHADDFLRWISTKEAILYSLSKFQPHRDRTWVSEYILKISRDTSCWNQVIIANERNVGYCGLSNISKMNKCAEYYILIGDVGYWNIGVGTKAGSLVLEHGFDNIGLHRIWLTVSSPNLGAIRSYEKLGFQKEGVMKEACNRENSFHDKIVMGMLCHEWNNKIMY